MTSHFKNALKFKGFHQFSFYFFITEQKVKTGAENKESTPDLYKSKGTSKLMIKYQDAFFLFSVLFSFL